MHSVKEDKLLGLSHTMGYQLPFLGHKPRQNVVQAPFPSHDEQDCQCHKGCSKILRPCDAIVVLAQNFNLGGSTIGVSSKMLLHRGSLRVKVTLWCISYFIIGHRFI